MRAKTFRIDLLILLGALLGLAACATPAQRMTRKLVEVGVPARQAQCMGTQLAARLSTAELRQLDRLARQSAGRLARTRLEDLPAVLAEIDNPALVGEVVRTGLFCLI